MTTHGIVGARVVFAGVPLLAAVRPRRPRFHAKMADENEDQWLYGDSADGKDGFPENSDSQPADNDTAFNNQEDSYQQNEDTQEEHENETSDKQGVT